MKDLVYMAASKVQISQIDTIVGIVVDPFCFNIILIMLSFEGLYSNTTWWRQAIIALSI